MEWISCTVACSPFTWCKFSRSIALLLLSLLSSSSSFICYHISRRFCHIDEFCRLLHTIFRRCAPILTKALSDNNNLGIWIITSTLVLVALRDIICVNCYSHRYIYIWNHRKPTYNTFYWIHWRRCAKFLAFVF